MRIEDLSFALDTTPKGGIPPIVEFVDVNGERLTAWIYTVAFGRVTLQMGTGVLVEKVHPDNIIRIIPKGAK